jgi:hypothetical protein
MRLSKAEYGVLDAWSAHLACTRTEVIRRLLLRATPPTTLSDTAAVLRRAHRVLTEESTVA